VRRHVVCFYCGKVLALPQQQILARLYHRKIFGGGTEREGRFHPVCFEAFTQQGGRPAKSPLAWEVLRADVIPLTPSTRFPGGPPRIAAAPIAPPCGPLDASPPAVTNSPRARRIDG
jgi:hypothetical protein